MSTVNIGAPLPTGSAIIGRVKIVDTGGTNEASIDANNNMSVTIRQAANAMAVDASNNAHVALYSGASAIGVKAANTPPTLTDVAMVHSISPNNTGLPVNVPAIVQSANNKSTGSVASLAKAFTSNNSAGNSIVVACGVGNGTAPTVTDSNGNFYTQIKQIPNGSAFNVALFLSVGTALGGGIVAGANTVTVNNGGSTASIAMEIYELPGLLTLTAAQPDVTQSATGTSATAATSAISTTSPNQYAFAAVGVGTAAQTITVGSGWTNDSGQQNPTTPAGLFSFISMSQFLESAVPVTPQATFTSEPWAIAVATFRPVLLGIQGTIKEITVASATLASVASSASSVTLWALNTSARGRMLYNESSSTLYLAYAATATTSAYTVQIPPNSYWEMPSPIFTGAVSGIWSSANGNARTTETY